MTTVSGILRDAKGMALPGVAVTLRYVPQVIGYAGGAVAQNNLTYLTNSTGLLSMPGLVAGPYDLSIAMPIGTSASVTAAVTARGVVNGEDAQSLEDFLQTTIGEITPTILSQAIAAAEAAAASAAAAGVNTPRVDMELAIAGGFVPVNNVIYTLDGWRYIGVTGATALPGLPGLLPLQPVTPFHFGAVGNGAADDRAAFAAMDAYGGDVYIPKPPVGYKFASPITLANVAVQIDGTVTYAALSDGGKLQFGFNQFRDDAFVQINRFPGRTFLGAAAEHSGNRRGVNSYGTDPMSQKVASWPIKQSTVAAISDDPNGLIAFLGGAYCQPGVDADICCGIAGIVRHDGISGMARGGYFEAISARTAGYDASADAGVEIQVGNRSGITPTVSPYSMSNSIVNGLHVAPESQENYTIGDADTPLPAAANRAGAGMFFAGSGTTAQVWTAGVVFTNNGLYRDGGGFGNALLLAQKHKLRWDATAFNEGASIWSQVTDPTKKVALAFINNAVLFQGESGQTTASITTAAGSVNYLDLTGSVTGVATQIRALGDDANIDLRLTPKGTGAVRFGTHTGTSDVAITGYITIKDAAGTVRKLAVIS